MSSEGKLDRTLPGLGIRQPWGELILRGYKKLEIRTMPVKMRGKIYLYAGKRVAVEEFANNASRNHGLDTNNLPLECVIGTVEILDCRLAKPGDAKKSLVPWEIMNGKYAWELGNPVRYENKIDAEFKPYGMWFYPFMRLGM